MYFSTALARFLNNSSKLILKNTPLRRIFNSLLVEFLFPFQNLLILHKNEITNSGKRVVCHLVSRENVNIKTVLGGDGL